MRININLASQPYQDSRQFWGYWGTGLIVLSLVSALLVFLAATGFVRAGHDREQISKLKDKSPLMIARRAKLKLYSISRRTVPCASNRVS